MASPSSSTSSSSSSAPSLALASCSNLNRLILASSLLVVLLAFVGNNSIHFVNCQEQLNVESRQQKDNDDLTATIKYLDQVDKYFSQLARPRFGRSEFKQPVYRVGQNSIDRNGQFQAYSLADLINGHLAQKYRESTY